MLDLKITIPELNDLLHLFMCCDPWPMGTGPEHDRIENMLNRLSRECGYDEWVSAFHQLLGAQHTSGPEKK